MNNKPFSASKASYFILVFLLLPESESDKFNARCKKYNILYTYVYMLECNRMQIIKLNFLQLVILSQISSISVFVSRRHSSDPPLEFSIDPRKILMASTPLCNTNLINCKFSVLKLLLLERRASSSALVMTPVLKKGVCNVSMFISFNNSGKLSNMFLLTCSISRNCR